MITVIGIGGEPASGKSTLVLETLRALGWPDGFRKKKAGTLRWQESDELKLIVLGEYGGSAGTFGGTDRLSMAVQPDAEKVLASWASGGTKDGWAVLFEGDRLFSKSFLSCLERIESASCDWVMLYTDDPFLKERHQSRNDTQTATWLKGRATKVKKILDQFEVVSWANNTPADLSRNVKRLLKLLGTNP